MRADSVSFLDEFLNRWSLLRFFSQTKYASFQRQLNLYGFSRKKAETSMSCYYHPCFLREDPDLVRNMVRCKIKGTGKNRQGPKKKSARRSAPAASPPPILTPVREENSSSSDAESVDSTTPESQDSKPSFDLPFAGSSFPFYNVDVMSNDQTDMEMGCFEGSTFHLLEPDPIACIDHDTAPVCHALMAQAPIFPHSSFHADGGMPRLKLQPRSSSHYGATSMDFMSSCFL
jgi:HSF-type DNA-binding